MRNLKLQYCRKFPATSVENVEFILLDPNGSNVYLVTHSKLYSFNIRNGVAAELIEQPGIVGTEFLAQENVVCLATEAGEVLTVNPETREITEGIFCEVGIACMAWSPDQEVVAFVTKNTNVVVMTCTYDIIAEQPLRYHGDSAGQFVNVGWGAKETQFHGSEGKAVANQKSDYRQPENIADLIQNTAIAWRADGAHFAVSFLSAEVGRMFIVFDKEGQLEYISERSVALESAIVWRPSGTWIAVPQRMPNKSTVALFEKNGLRHREIVLPFDLADEPIVNLKWSADSDVLVLYTRMGDACSLYLYTIGNYHWYLKQVMRFDTKNALATYTWDNHIGEEKTLHIVLQDGQFLTYKWCWQVDRLNDSGVVGVIDGKTFLLTDFSKSVAPPPMCEAKLQVDDYINAASFVRNERSELQLCLLDSENNFHIYKAPLRAPLQLAKIGERSFRIEQQRNANLLPLELGNMLWYNEDCLLATTSAGSYSKALLIEENCAVGGELSIKDTLHLSGTVCALSNGSTELAQFYVHTLQAGKIHPISVRADNTLKLEPLHSQLEQTADQLQWYSTPNFNISGLIVLKENACLYVDAKRITGEVTSICLAGNYLAYTKLGGLFFLRLADGRIMTERKIERGGKLVAAIAKDARIVLQMPRGNLEAISPRVLALQLIGTLLEQKLYYEAMELLRKQRINLNLICDHNMCAFVDSLDAFLNDIKNPNWLNLFFSDLQNEDFTCTMYADNYSDSKRVYPEGFKITQKIDYLCEQLCVRMEQRQATHFDLAIVTAYVKRGQLEKALDLIWRMKHNEGEAKRAEDALKYLLYLVDVNELYNVALGTYDFGLVLFVARKSQKDPKEFLPFLNELKSHEPNYRKFKVDEHLKRHEKALHHIARCPAAERFVEALCFVQRHKLYQRALQCYTGQLDCTRQICLAFGDYLRANGKLENASLMYERGGNLTQALASAKHVLDWRRALALARRDDTVTLGDVALSLVPALQENGRYLEAFELVKTYGSNHTEALQGLLKGRLFLHAIFEARMSLTSNECDLIDSVVEPQLQAYVKQLEINLAGDEELFRSYKQRLLQVREQRSKRVLEGDTTKAFAEVDECDLLSDTTSMHSSRYTESSGTGKTFRSSKNRRKHERKLLNLKPGNPFEDIALIDALYNLIQKIIGEQQHVRDTCKALLELQMDELALAVQHRFRQLVQLMESSLDSIWIPEMANTQKMLTGPNLDYQQLQNEQRYGLIIPQKRFKPQLSLINWEHEILR